MVKTTVPPRAAARLPERPPAHTGMDRLKGLGALVTILAIVVGVPYLLVTLFGPPWPEKMPDRELLFSQLGAEDILKIISVVIWLAWAHFVVCLITEAVAERRGRGMSPQVPLGGGSQTLARRLVSGVVLLAGAASVTVPVAQAASMPSMSVETSVTSTTTGGSNVDVTRQVETPSKVIPGVTGVRTNDDHKGQVVKYTEVRTPEARNYDCLWDIAERYLGDGRRYKEIYDLNKNKLQPDGRRLVNPDLILPGWQVRLPADAKGPGVHTVKVAIEDVAKKTVDVKKTAAEEKAKPGTPAKTGARYFEKDTEKPSTVDIGDVKGDPGAAKEKPGGTADGKPGAEADPKTAGAGGTAEDAQPKGGTVQAGQPADGGFDLMTGVYGVGATLLAAGLAVALKRRRGWSLGPGPSTSDKNRSTEVDLRLAADVPTAEFVDRSLRQLGATFAQQDLPLPGVVAALVTSKELTLVLAPGESQATPPPPPWQDASGGNRWTIRRAYAPSGPVDAPAPYPALVTVGRNADGAIVLVDLDLAHGIASFGGITDIARDVAVSVAVELATNLWSDGAHVTMVGFGDDLSDLAPDRLTYFGSLEQAMTDVNRRTDHQVRTCDARGVGSVTRARVAYPDAATWGTEILVLSAPPSAEEANLLNRLAADPKRSVGVMVVGDVPVAPWRFVVDEKGQAVCRLIGLEVDAHRVSPAQYADLVGLFRAADAEAREKRRAEADVPAYEVSVTDLSQPAQVEIDLLGAVEIDAQGEVDPGRIELTTEIAVFLASQDYGVHPNVLAGAIWPRGISDELRDSALEHTRRWLGRDAVYTDETGRWVLNRNVVRVDWDVFRTLAKQASLMEDPRGPLATAIGLVHGAAWSGLPAGRYSWLAASGIERKMAESIVDVALRLAEASLRYNDGNLARTALQTGLGFSPASEELWRATLRLAAHFGGQSDISIVAGQMYTALRKHGGPRGAEAETDALVDELLPGYRRAVA